MPTAPHGSLPTRLGRTTITTLGGNRARGNGNPAQCAGVVCAAGRG